MADQILLLRGVGQIDLRAVGAIGGNGPLDVGIAA